MGSRKRPAEDGIDARESKTLIISALEAAKPIHPTQLVEARELEMQRLQEFQVHTTVPISAAQGRKIIATRWVDVQKTPELCRSRLVVKDFANGPTETTIFAATPSLAALRVGLSLLARNWAKGWQLRCADVSVAFLHAKVDPANPIFVHPPPEAGLRPGLIWQLHRSLYGLRSAPKAWQDHLAAVLEKLQVKRSLTEPCVFYSPNLYIVVHVDDFAAFGTPAELDRVFKALQQSLLIKIDSPLSITHPVTFLGRQISIDGDAIALGMSEKLVKKLAALFSISPSSNAVATPMVNELDSSEGAVALPDEGQSLYRSGVGLALYMSSDRPDCQYVVKELSRRLGKASEADMSALKRLARYLCGSSHLQLHFAGKWSRGDLVTYTDANWATCRNTRRSTSGVVVTLGGDVLFSGSKTQTSVALSSGESELYAVNAGASEALYLHQLLSEALPEDARPSRCPTILIDASATLGMVDRIGLGGRAKHIEVRQLWLQERTRCGDLVVKKIPRAGNISDLLTKGPSLAELSTFNPMLSLTGTANARVCSVKVRYKRSATSLNRKSWTCCT